MSETLFPPSTIKTAVFYRAAVREFVLIFSAGALLIVAVALGAIRLDNQAQTARIEARDAMQVELASKLIGHDFETVTSDLRMLSKMPDTLAFINSGKNSDRGRLAELFRVFASESKLYDQVRFVDARGMEAVRINYGNHSAVIVPDDRLQDKSGRYFFRDAFKLAAGQIYVSPLDLNVERNQLELPYKPMIRFGAPVFDRNGQKKGVVLLNYFGSVLLNNFKTVFTGSGQRAMLLNREGYWLSSPDPGDEWGFMLGRQRTFGKDLPEEWKRILTADHGSIRTSNGVFTFATVYPLLSGQSSATGSPLPAEPSARALNQNEYYWKIVSYRSPASSPFWGLGGHPVVQAILPGSLLLWALLSGYIAVFRAGRKRWQATLAESENRLREISVTLAEGVYVIDESGRIVFTNPAAQRELGYSEAELLGQNAHELFHYQWPDGTPYPEEACEIGRVALSGQIYRAAEETFWSKKGVLLPVAVSSSPIMRDGRVAGSVVAFHDITGRKLAQQMLEQAMSELEHSSQETERINAQLRAANSELERISQSDGLTGVANRRHLDAYLEKEWRSAARAGRPLSLVMIDIDHFKAYNDHYGHQGGDDCLKEVAGALSFALGRPHDLLARYGGEEFAVVLPDTPLEGALHIAESLRSTVEDLHILHAESATSKYVTVSLGVAAMIPDVREAIPAVLVAAADHALYRAKAQGRNRVCNGGVE
ncbi:MAG TPA: diguanylate cyclase [Sulfuricella sp.]|nr:diguanylate cyclase [Sulfuricella sp.]